MNYAGIKYCDIANGLGCRTVLFVSGCRNACKGCFQPQTWDFTYGECFDEQVQQKVLDSLKPEYIEGMTLLGGEPFEEENQISFEYTMIDGVSDSPEQAQLLAKKLAGMGAHVNMIPLNNVTESGLHTSSRQAIRRFQTILEENGVTATLRRTLGSDIDASCGQLRRKYESN